MKNKFYVIFSILFCIATLFMGVGYASINSISLNVFGEMTAQVQEGVFIAEVNYNSSVNANLENSKIITAYQTSLNSSIELSDLDSNSSITYELVIYNNSDKNFLFQGIIFDDKFYSNKNIIYTLDGLDIGYELYPKKEVVFNIIFKYDNNAIVSSEINKLESYLNFVFDEAVMTTFIYEDKTINKLASLVSKRVNFNEIVVNDGTVVRCNQGAIPSYSNNVVSASDITVPTVCQVFDTLKETIESADDTVNNLLMIDNENASEEITVFATKKINLDINGKTNISSITGETPETTHYIVNNGNLNVKDSIGTGLLKTNFYLFDNYGNLNLNSGNYEKFNADSTVGAIVRTYKGVVNINDSNLKTDQSYVAFTSGSDFTELKINNSILVDGGSTGGAVSNVGTNSIISIMNSTVSNALNGGIYGNAIGGDIYICGSKISGGSSDILINANQGSNIHYTSNNIFTDGSSTPVVNTPIEYYVVKNNLNTCIDNWYKVKDSFGKNITYSDGSDVLVGHNLQIVSKLSDSLVFDDHSAGIQEGNRLWTYEPWEVTDERIDAQRFIILPSNDLTVGYYNLAMYYYPSFYISNYEGTSANNNQVALVNASTINSAKFKIISHGINSYSFMSEYSTCIDIPSASTTPEQYLQMYNCNSTNAQNWKLVRFK